VVSTPLKNISQWEALSHIMENKRMFQTTNQIMNEDVRFPNFISIYVCFFVFFPQPLVAKNGFLHQTNAHRLPFKKDHPNLAKLTTIS